MVRSKYGISAAEAMESNVCVRLSRTLLAPLTDDRLFFFFVALVTDLGKSRAILAFDLSSDGFTVAAGTELQGDDALVLYWSVFSIITYALSHFFTIGTLANLPLPSKHMPQPIRMILQPSTFHPQAPTPY